MPFLNDRWKQRKPVSFGWYPLWNETNYPSRRISVQRRSSLVSIFPSQSPFISLLYPDRSRFIRSLVINGQVREAGSTLFIRRLIRRHYRGGESKPRRVNTGQTFPYPRERMQMVYRAKYAAHRRLNNRIFMRKLAKLLITSESLWCPARINCRAFFPPRLFRRIYSVFLSSA